MEHVVASDKAARRSGARGVKARKGLNGVEEQLNESMKRLKVPDSDIDPTAIQIGTTSAVDMLTELQSFLDAIDSAGAEGRARRILMGLGFKRDAIEKPYSKLSGGWSTRCTLACALFQSSDVLVRDKPTNFIDLPAIIWLQGYIQGLENVTVLVT